MIEIRNLMFQPLTFQLAGGIESLHLGPRERQTIADEQVSEEMRRAVEGGFVTLGDVPVSEESADPEPVSEDQAVPEDAQTKKRR